MIQPLLQKYSSTTNGKSLRNAPRSLNKRCELMNLCLHRWPYHLDRVKCKPDERNQYMDAEFQKQNVRKRLNNEQQLKHVTQLRNTDLRSSDACNLRQNQQQSELTQKVYNIYRDIQHDFKLILHLIFFFIHSPILVSLTQFHQQCLKTVDGIP